VSYYITLKNNLITANMQELYNRII